MVEATNMSKRRDGNEEMKDTSQSKSNPSKSKSSTPVKKPQGISETSAGQVQQEARLNAAGGFLFNPQ
jgi:hypothetical protein